MINPGKGEKERKGRYRKNEKAANRKTGVIHKKETDIHKRRKEKQEGERFAKKKKE